MTLKQFLDALNAEQKAFFSDYIEERQDVCFKDGYQKGHINGLYDARNTLNERFGL